jgi:hypothetical protein
MAVFKQDETTAYVSGERAAERTLYVIREEIAIPDRLMMDLLDLLEVDGRMVTGSPRLRGWARLLQKAFEVEGGR